MVTDYFFVYSYFFQREEKNEKIFWDMEIIGNRRKMIFIIQNIKQKIVKIDSFRSELKILFGFLKGRKLRSSLQKTSSADSE